MNLSFGQKTITIIMMILGTQITRFLPFTLFPDKRETPKYIIYLGKVLPYAIMGFLIIYCLKDVSLTTKPFGIPEFIAIASVALLHLWKRNIFLSISIGTAIYMLLIQFVFMGF